MLRFALCVLMVVAAYATRQCHTPVARTDKCGGESGRYCNPEEETCVEGVCECTTGKGQPELICAAEDDDFASILSDPQAWTVNKRQMGYLPVPCMYEFSHFKTKTQTTENGQCDVKIMVYHKRVQGKLYVGGFEVHIKAKNLAFVNGVQNMVYKADGYSDGDQYCFHYQASKNGGNSYGGNVMHNKYKIDRAPYTFRVDQDTNRIKLQISQCGLHLQFRPANESVSVFDQDYLPGLAFKVDLNKEPTYLSKDTVVSLPPDREIPDTRDNTDVMTYLAFTGAGNAYNDYLYYSDKCPGAKTALEACSSNAAVDLATAKCRFILDRPRFVKCFSASGSTPDGPHDVNRMLTLYTKCISSFCSASSGARVSSCNQMKGLIDELSDTCTGNLPPLSGFPCSF